MSVGAGQLEGGISPPRDGAEWHVLGHTYWNRAWCESAFAFETLDPPGTFVPPHIHPTQDEFIYVLDGTPTLRLDGTETLLAPGMCAGFRGGSGEAHCLVNRSDRDVVYLEIGDRRPGDGATYPEDDLAVEMGPDGTWRYSRKDGTPV